MILMTKMFFDVFCVSCISLCNNNTVVDVDSLSPRISGGMLPTLKRVLEPAAITIHWSPESLVATKVESSLQRKIWMDVMRDKTPAELSEKTKQTSCSDETLGVTMFPFSQLSPDICRETLAVGCGGKRTN